MTIKRQTLAFIVPVILFITMVLLARTSWFITQPEALSVGLVFDFTLTIPIIYFLIVRKTNVPNITVVPVFIIGTVIASNVIPADQQFYLNQIKTWVIPIVELGVLSFVLYKVRQINLAFKQEQAVVTSFYDTLKKAVSGVLPKPVDAFLATEIATFYYGFFHWKKYNFKSKEFSYHKENGAIALFYVIIGLVIVETSIIHLLIMRWNELAAWILSGLSIYTGLQLFGFVRSMSKLPTAMYENHVMLRYGLMAQLKVDYRQIKSIEVNSKDLEEKSPIKKLSILGDLEAHNFVIHFKETLTISGLYGIKKSCNGVALHIDKQEAFSEALKAKISP